MSIDANEIPDLLRQMAEGLSGETIKELLEAAAGMCDSHLNLTAIMDSIPPVSCGLVEMVCPNCTQKTSFPSYSRTQEELDETVNGKVYTCKCGETVSMEGATV